MAGTFEARTQILLDKHEGGKLRGEVIVDQVYAQYQHETLHLKHPAGGKAKFLWDPVRDDANKALQQLAARTLWGNIDVAMIRATERWSRGVFEQAPLEFGDLKASAHPRVKKGGKLIYDRPPAAKRLSESEIEIKRELRSYGFGNAGNPF